MISDAGTPGISDPGFYLAREAAKAGITVQTLPGPTACIPAIVSSGLPCDRFCFEGFIPQKKGRQTYLESLKDEVRTMIFYESPYRVVKTLQQFAEVFGDDRQVSCCREISKLHEESVRIFPTQIESVILEMAEFEPHYLLIVGRENNTDTMELQVEVRPDFYSDEINRMLALKKKLAGRLQSVLGLGVNVKLVEPRSIERSVGKAKRVIDNRKL